MIATLTAILFLMIIVAFHEAGHALAARACGEPITKFFVGFGPSVWERTTRNGVRWGVKAIPLGGFVEIPGQDKATTWRRVIICAAGPAASILCGALLIFVAATGWGYNRSPLHTIPATARATVWTTGHMAASVTELAKPSFYGGVLRSAIHPTEDIERPTSVVGVAQATDEYPVRDRLIIGAVITIWLGVVNLLPVPLLDGGRVVVALVEGAVSRWRHSTWRADPRLLAGVSVVLLGPLVLVSLVALVLDIANPL